MKRYRVELSPGALEHAEAIRAWWLENRPASLNLFLDELAAVIRKLEALPRIGSLYDAAGFQEMRRISLPRSRYHVYYDVSEETRVVRIHALWHTARGRGPELR